jgi:hypothetical protein
MDVRLNPASGQVVIPMVYYRCYSCLASAIEHARLVRVADTDLDPEPRVSDERASTTVWALISVEPVLYVQKTQAVVPLEELDGLRDLMPAGFSLE